MTDKEWGEQWSIAMDARDKAYARALSEASQEVQDELARCQLRIDELNEELSRRMDAVMSAIGEVEK